MPSTSTEDIWIFDGLALLDTERAAGAEYGMDRDRPLVSCKSSKQVSNPNFKNDRE